MQPAYGNEYADLYEKHWWWQSRERILEGILSKLELPESPDICDFGCGDGVSFPMLRSIGNVCGIECDTSLITDRYRDSIHTQPLGDPAYEGLQFDLVTAFDVVEHIEDDVTAMTSLADLVRPGGWLVMTVPAFMSLWDKHDEINQHYRRYTKSSFRKVIPAVFDVSQLRYFFHAIYCVKLGVAILNRFRAQPAKQHSLPPAALNAAAREFCVLESRLLSPLRLPCGSSLLAVLQKSVH